MSSIPVIAFTYRAQNAAGDSVSGTIDAANHTDAMRQLDSLGVRVLEIAPAQLKAPSRPIRSEDFLAFNHQLAQLTRAGLPIEQGLRLIAHDLRSRRLANTVQQIADELERGVPLGEAFDKQRGQFPSLYGRLIDAGVKANNLPAMLMNLGTHIELVQRMREHLWRAISYPLMVLIGLLAILAFVGTYVLPQFAMMFEEFGTELPTITKLVLGASRALPWIIAVVVGVPLVLTLIWWFLRRRGSEQSMVDYLFLKLPLIGPALKQNRIARWCDATRLAVDAGLDLPAAIDLAGMAVGSPLLKQDGDAMKSAIESGKAMNPKEHLRLLSPTVPLGMNLASQRGQLAETLTTLATMYQQQAENRMNLIPVILTPLLLAIIAVLIGLMIAALFAPMMSLIRAVSGVGGGFLF